ncbi:MAG: ABC transporter permease, partial [Abitibacteriaceae bacterium]|nr:ABC transporter permease [Abditibacteriaceae bacterium]
MAQNSTAPSTAEPVISNPSGSAATANSRLYNVWQSALRFQSFFGLFLILLISMFASPIRDGHNVFLGADNLLNIVRFASENGIIAVGMTLVILTGGIDLSVGAILALCAVGAASCMMRHNLGTAPTVILMLGLGALIGVINGVVTTRLAIQSFITTLAMMSAARGVASLWSGGYAIPLEFGNGAGLAPDSFKSLFAGQINLLGLSIPVQALYFLIAGSVAAFFLKRTGFGRHVYAVGANDTAARLSGINVNRIRII